MLKKAAIFGLAGVMAVAAGCGSNKDAGNAVSYTHLMESNCI